MKNIKIKSLKENCKMGRRKNNENYEFTVSDTVNNIVGQKLKFKAKNEAQKEFVKLITDKEIVICSGPAGTGKSYVSIARAIELLQSKENNFEKIIIFKPAVEVEEKHGFLPGDIMEKIMPYAESSLGIIEKLIGKAARDRMIMDGIIEIKALAYIRGANIDNAIVIMEEAQNMSPNQMKTLLTRIGINSKFIISGDMDQSDRYTNIKQSGLYDAMNRLRSIEEIGFFEFTANDIVRNPIISKILNLYDSSRNDKNKNTISSPVNKERVILNESMEQKNKKITNKKMWWEYIPKYIRW